MCPPKRVGNRNTADTARNAAKHTVVRKTSRPLSVVKWQLRSRVALTCKPRSPLNQLEFWETPAANNNNKQLTRSGIAWHSCSGQFAATAWAWHCAGSPPCHSTCKSMPESLICFGWIIFHDLLRLQSEVWVAECC